MKYLDPNSVDLAKQIAGLIKSDTPRDTVLTALSALLFGYGKQFGINPEFIALSTKILSETADEALAELNEAGVTL